MRRSLTIGLLLAACLARATAAAPPADATAIPLQQYIQALDSALATARVLKQQPQRAQDLRQSIPPIWQVEANGKSFAVPTESLRRDLGAWQKKPDEELLGHIVQHLETLRYQASAYESSTTDFPATRGLLNNILARREFRNVHGQSWIDRMKERLGEFLIRLLGRAISSSAIPVISDVVVYGLITLAASALAYWIYRSVRDSARLESMMPGTMAVSEKEWPIWMREAQTAAARGDWRDAIHLAYWAGISFLEMQGAWRPDVARTPREYLRLLPASSAQQPALRNLTVQLEAVWYGMQAADAGGFQQALAELERLGCPCS